MGGGPPAAAAGAPQSSPSRGRAPRAAAPRADRGGAEPIAAARHALGPPRDRRRPTATRAATGGYKGELCHIRSRKGDGWVKAECVGGHF